MSAYFETMSNEKEGERDILSLYDSQGFKSLTPQEDEASPADDLCEVPTQ